METAISSVLRVIIQFEEQATHQHWHFGVPGFIQGSDDLIVETKASDEFRSSFCFVPNTVTQSRRIYYKF
jgi:hypothetical protein